VPNCLTVPGIGARRILSFSEAFRVKTYWTKPFGHILHSWRSHGGFSVFSSSAAGTSSPWLPIRGRYAGAFAGQSRSGAAIGNESKGVPTVTTRDLHNIDWAAVAARARADLGNELVAHVSERLRTTMTAYAAQVRPGDGWSRRFGDPSAMDE